MATKDIIILLALVIVAVAQPKLSDIPEGCTITPSNPDGCLKSAPIPYFEACGVYSDGRCRAFCGRLLKKPTSCVTNRPNRFLAFRLRIRCLGQCFLARQEITRFANQGVNRSELHSLIYLGSDEKGKIKQRKYVYQFSEEKITYTTCPPHPDVACFGSNECICSSCWSQSASCPNCCSWAGHIYLP